MTLPVPRWSILAVLIVVTVILGSIGVAYHAGGRAERLKFARHARQDTLEHNAQELRATATRLDAERRVRLAEVAKDSAVRGARGTARARVRIVSDTVVQLVGSTGAVGPDSVGPKFQVPREVVTVMQRDDATILQDSIVIHAQAAELQTLYRRDTLHIARERLLQAELDAAKPQRCGRRCGFVAGVTTTATVVLAVTHPETVVKAVSWVVRLVR